MFGSNIADHGGYSLPRTQMPPIRKDISECPTGVSARIERLREIPADDLATLKVAIRKALSDRSPMVRSEAVDQARKHDFAEFEPQALALLSEKNQFVLYSAIQYLGSRHESERISATWLYPLLAHQKSLVRIETIESLGQIEDRKSLPLIAKRLEDEDELVRAYAAMILADSGFRKYREQVERAAAKETTGNIQAHFARALYEFGDLSQFHRLIEFLSADHHLTRCAAANSLNGILLDREQLQQAIAAVANARIDYLFRADQTTMETVERQLREYLESASS
jgi:HEAT repeat protein